MEKPTLPKGTRDFGPLAMAKRQFIINAIQTVFQKFGFLPLETPAMENLSTLTGKYGEEGDKLLFRILDSGEYFEKMQINLLSGQKIARIRDSLYDFLKLITEHIFNELPEIYDIRYFDRVINVYNKIYQNETWIASRYLTDDEKEIVKKFFEEEKVYLVLMLMDFFKSAELFSDNYKEKFDLQYRRFRDNTLNKRILPKVLNYFSSKDITPEISEKGLRYDLTVPFARYVVMNRHEITLPFKRYQIQPVWRADRPQKGRYREFYQCDADVVGTYSLVCETEIILMIKEVFSKLNIQDYSIKINHRGVLAGIAEMLNVKGKEAELYTAIDKLDKIGEQGVRGELSSKGFNESALNKLFTLLQTSGSNSQKMDLMRKTFQYSEAGLKGINDLQQVLALLNQYGSKDEHVEVDVALARGLSYYTGTIFEVKINNVAIGSVSGGGRYDNLTQAFGAKEPLPGIGISFGVDRIYDAMEERKLFSKETQRSSRVLICHLDETCMTYGFKVLSQLRDADISSEIYPDQSKLKKQLDYANKKNIPFTLVIGSEEMSSGELVLKNMEAGEQEKLSLNKIIQNLKS